MMEIALDLLRAAVIGIGATLSMDLWNLFLKRAFGIPSLDYALLGRWIAHMPGGQYRHTSIARARPMPLERPLGWATHYTIGAGLGTVAFPMLVLQPALGLGIASSKVARPARARLKSLATHTVFGLGIYGCGYGLDRLAEALS